MDIFTNKVCVVTGGGSGIGRGLCEALGKRGATVVVADLLLDDAHSVAFIIQRLGGQAKAVELDVRQSDQMAALITSVFDQHGRLDYLFNNAGIGLAGEAQHLTVDQWQRTLDTNLYGVVYGVAAAYPRMVAQGFGHLVNVASLAALIPFPTAVPYATAKTAVLGLSRSLRVEGKGLGVKVSAVCPGFVDTRIYDNTIKAGVTTAQVKSVIPSALLPLDQAVAAILRGVAANRGVIAFPFTTRLLWWLSKVCYPAATWIGHRSLRKFRALERK